MSFSLDGFAILSNVLQPEEVSTIATALKACERAGRRGLLDTPEVAALSISPKVVGLLAAHFNGKPFPVRAIYFDKTPKTNWMIPWHQDLMIAVRRKVDVSGYGPWNTKAGVPHVQPPPEVLEDMVTIRIHLDETDESNGALRVLPGSHRLGKVTAEDITELRQTIPERLCAVSAGGVMLMRPLLLHASSRSTTFRHRRVLHIEYAATGLPAGLEWYERCRPIPIAMTSGTRVRPFV